MTPGGVYSGRITTPSSPFLNSNTINSAPYKSPNLQAATIILQQQQQNQQNQQQQNQQQAMLLLNDPMVNSQSAPCPRCKRVRL